MDFSSAGYSLSPFTSWACTFLINAMLNLRAWILSPLLVLPLKGQDNVPVPPPVLPDNVELPAVDMITPVPAPVIAPGTQPDQMVQMPKDLKINNQGGKIDGNMETGVHFGGPVKIQGDNGLEAFSDTATLDLKAKTILLEGNVSIYQGNILQRGQSALYHYETKYLDTRGMKASADPILMESGKFTAETKGGKQIFYGENAGITTEDVEEPSYWFRAKKTRVYPGDKVVFNDLKVYSGDTPVFWLPYLSQPLNAELGYHFIPGARSNWGPYLLNTYGIMLGGTYNPETEEKENAWLLSLWRFDFRAKRGFGTGVDFVDTRVENREEISGLSLYYQNDLAPNTVRSGLERDFVNEDRYRIQLKHRLDLDFEKDAKWRLDTNLTYLSDQYYLEDFQPDIYRENPSPDNTIGVFRRDDESLLSMFLRLEVNDFYRTDTRLPEIAYDQARRPFFGLPILHEGTTSFAIIGEKAPDATSGSVIESLSDMAPGDPRIPQLLAELSGYERGLAEKMVALPLSDPDRKKLKSNLLDIGYSRFNTYQEFSMPMLLGNFLSLTPEVGAGYTRYDSVHGPFEAMDKKTFHFSTEAAVKFSKDYGNFQDHDRGLSGLIHVIQPYTTWSVVSTDDVDPYFPEVDRLSSTTRPRPLDPMRFTAVDELNTWNILRFGMRNRLLTQRDGQTYEWLYLNTYVDAFIQDPEGKRTVSNLYNQMRWHPLPWMSLDLETQFPIVNDGSGFTEITPRLRFLPNENTEISLGYRLLDNHPTLLDSNRIDLKTYTRINDYWGIGTRHILEMDDGTLEVEQYTLHRDLGNWVAGMGVTHRDDRLRDEYGVIFSLTLKDFPSVSLPFQLDAE